MSERAQNPRTAEAESRYAKIVGWSVVLSTGLLLGSGALDALLHGLPSRWSQSAGFAIFVLAHVGTIGTKRPPIARALASLLYLGCILEAYWFSWGAEDTTTYAWSNLGLEAIRDGILLWGLGLGALVLALVPPRAHFRLLGASLGLFLMLPWIWGLSHGSSRVTIMAGPDWLNWGWYIQPAFLALAFLLPVALGALIETAYKVGGMGAVEHGVNVGLGFLSLAPIALILLHQISPEMVQPATDVSHLAPPANSELVLVSSPTEGHHADHAESPSEMHEHGDGGGQPEAPTDHSTTEHGSAAESGAQEELSLCGSRIFPHRSVDDLREDFVADSWMETTEALLERRYPDAAWLVGALKDPEHLERGFPSPPVSWRRIVTGASSAIYESVRLVGFQRMTEGSVLYPVAEEQLLEVPQLSLFPRGLLKDKLPIQIRALRLTRTHFEGEAATKQLEDILDQLNAYTWALITEVALLDQTAGRDIAARDAVLANLFYVNAYLSFARSDQPEAYQLLAENEAMRATTILLWERALCSLELSAAAARLGIEAAALTPLVFGSGHIHEVERLRSFTPQAPPVPTEGEEAAQAPAEGIPPTQPPPEAEVEH